MAGVKGRSGGARAGAGRKKTPAVPIAAPEASEDGRFDPRPSMELIARGLMEVSPQQFNALKALMQDSKKSEGGKKNQQAGKAKQAASKFAPTAAPKLIVNNR